MQENKPAQIPADMAKLDANSDSAKGAAAFDKAGMFIFLFCFFSSHIFFSFIYFPSSMSGSVCLCKRECAHETVQAIQHFL